MLRSMYPRQFRFVGTIADLDQTVPGEAAYPALVIVVDACNELTRIIVPPSAQSASLELLVVGRPLIITGDIKLDPVRPLTHAVATCVELLDAHH
jgi:hypothetical protein